MITYKVSYKRDTISLPLSADNTTDLVLTTADADTYEIQVDEQDADRTERELNADPNVIRYDRQ